MWLWRALIPESLGSPWIRSEPEAGFNLSPGVLLIPSPGALENQTTACWESSWCCRAWLYGQGWALLPGGGWDNPREIPPDPTRTKLSPNPQVGQALQSLGWNLLCPCPSPGLALPPLPALVRAPEPFCPPNKSERAGSSSAVFARAESHRRLEFKNTEVAFSKQEENAPAPGSSQSLFWEQWERAGRSLAVPALSPSPLEGDSSKEPHAGVTSVVAEPRWWHSCRASSPGGPGRWG